MTLESTAEKPQETDPQPVLTTDRLLLRPFTLADADMVQQLLESKAIASFTRSIDHPYPPGAAQQWIEKHEEYWSESTAAVFAVQLKTEESPQSLVGACGLQIKAADENAELGYWIGEDYWGKGFATEAAGRVLQFGFELGLHRIHACHMIHNPASGRVLEKIGMKREGVLRGHMKKWGVFYDVVCFGMLRDDRGGG